MLRFVEDNLDDDRVLLRSAEFYGAAIITRDNFQQVTSPSTLETTQSMYDNQENVGQYWTPSKEGRDLTPGLKAIKPYADANHSKFKRIKSF